MPSGDGGDRDSAGRRFVTTSWTLVAAAGETSQPGAREALETLCRAYWMPVYAYLRRSGAPAEQARDLTQGFFTELLEKRWFKQARRDRGRFRTFLLASLRNYVAHERERERALKRGAGRATFELDAVDAERAFALEPVDSDTPETIFERRWARAVFDRSVSRLAEESKATSDSLRFERLRPFLTDDSSDGYRRVAHELGVGESAVRVAVHRLRRRCGEILRAEVAETVHGEADVESELRHLIEVLRL